MMTKRVMPVCMLCFLLFSTLAATLLVRSVASSVSTVVYGPNLLTNPGFEYGLAGWSTSAGTAVYSADSSTFVSGHYSCKGVKSSTESLGRLYQDVTGITSPGNQYQISGWIKTNVTTEEDAVVIGLDYVASGGWTPEDGYIMEIGYVTGTQGWTFFQSELFTLPSMPTDAQALWFLLDFNNAVGTAWWDNVSLALVTYPVPVGRGTNVSVTLNDYVGLVFDNVVTSGSATAITTTNYPPPPSGIPFMGPVWDITTTAMFSGSVTIGIKYTDPDTASPTKMFETDIVPGDVNLDGVVNCTDLLLILKAMGSRPGDPRWNPNCDLNHNNKIDIYDLLIALKNYGRTSQWTDITWYVDTANNIIYGRTNHFSLIGIH